MATGITIGGASAFASSPILQVVTASTTSALATTSSSFVATNATITITPKSATSTILVIATGRLSCVDANSFGEATLFRGGTNLFNATDGGAEIYQSAAPASLISYDSPATTSATTYTVRVRRASGTGFCGWGNVATQNMIAIEIAN